MPYREERSSNLLVAFGIYLLLAAVVAFFDKEMTGVLGEMSGREFTLVGAIVAVSLLVSYNIFGIGASFAELIPGSRWMFLVLGGSCVLGGGYLYALTTRNPPVHCDDGSGNVV